MSKHTCNPTMTDSFEPLNVERAAMTLKADVDRLTAAVDSLEERLAPLLSEPHPPLPNSVRDVAESSVAEGILVSADRIRLRADQILELIGRL